MLGSTIALSRTSRTLLGAAAGAALILGSSVAQAAGDAAAGKVIYTTNCASCHGEKGAGDGVGAALNPKPRDFSKGEFNYDTDKDGKAGTDADLKNILKNGAAAYGGSPLMAAWGATLSDKDIDNVIPYVRTLQQKK